MRVKRLNAAAILPSGQYHGDAGFDLCACETAVLGPGERASVGTGIALEIPPGQPFAVAVGDRIAQLLIVAFASPVLVEVDELVDSERGERGFGSSGVAGV